MTIIIIIIIIIHVVLVIRSFPLSAIKYAFELTILCVGAS